MPLGIDRTHFYAEKVKKQEKDIRVSIPKSCTIFLEEPYCTPVEIVQNNYK